MGAPLISRNSLICVVLPVAVGLVEGDIAKLGTGGLSGVLVSDRATTATIAAGTAAQGLADGEATVELPAARAETLTIDAAIAQFGRVYHDNAGVNTPDPDGNTFVGWALEALSGAGDALVAIALAPAARTTVTYRQPAAGTVADAAFYIAPRPQRVVSAKEVHSVAGSDGGAVSLQITKDTGTDAPGAGTDLLTNNTNVGFDLKGTANTVQSGALIATAATLTLAAGDRLSVDSAGTATSVAGVTVVVELEDV